MLLYSEEGQSDMGNFSISLLPRMENNFETADTCGSSQRLADSVTIHHAVSENVEIIEADTGNIGSKLKRIHRDFQRVA